MKDKLIKVRRKHVDWKKCLDDREDTMLNLEFLKFKQCHPTMSDNRCAYNVLKTYYSTTAMLKYRMTGEF